MYLFDKHILACNSTRMKAREKEKMVACFFLVDVVVVDINIECVPRLRFEPLTINLGEKGFSLFCSVFFFGQLPSLSLSPTHSHRLSVIHPKIPSSILSRNISRDFSHKCGSSSTNATAQRRRWQRAPLRW